MEGEISNLGIKILGKWLGTRVSPRHFFTALQDKLIFILAQRGQVLDSVMRFSDVTAQVQHDKGEVNRLFREYFSEYALKGTPLFLRVGLFFMLGAWVPEGLRAQIIRWGVLSMARRYMAGEVKESLPQRLIPLVEKGLGVIVDVLGEATTNEEEATCYQKTYLHLLELLVSNKKLTSKMTQFQISLKLSSFYSQWNPADPLSTGEAVKARLRPLLDHIQAIAEEHQIKVGITFDLEQFNYAELTYRVFKELFMEPAYLGLEGVGIVVQAYLKNSEEILRSLAQWSRQRCAAGGAPSILIRLAKGAYWDHENIQHSQKGFPLPVFDEKWMSDVNYERLTDLLLSSPHLEAAIASHNPRSISQAIIKARHKKVPLQVQLLYGMNPKLENNLLKLGIPTHLYSPVGNFYEGMAYLARRLNESSSNKGIILQGLLPTAHPHEILKNPLEGRSWPPPKKEEVSLKGLDAPFVNEPLEDFSRSENILALQAALKEEELHLKNPLPSFSSPAFMAQEAKQALSFWSKTSPGRRASLLLRAAEIMRARKYNLMALIMLEAGKTLHEAAADYAEAVDFLEYYARHSHQRRLEHPQVEWEPLGVAAVISPWNFPLAILTGMAVAALVEGNTVVVKPAEQTPRVGYEFYKILKEAEIPKGVLHYLPGDSTVGRALLEQEEIKVVAFTGSKEVGLWIYEEMMAREVRVIAEMGGKNALIVDVKTAHPDDVVSCVLHSKFGYGGQKCSALDRLILVGDEESCVKIQQRLVDAARDLKVGDVRNFSNAMGPLIDLESQQRIIKLISQTLDQNQGRLLLDGRALSTQLSGYFVGPTLFEVPPQKLESDLWRRETFGPVLSITRVGTLKEALDLAQDSEFGLTGGLLTRSPYFREEVLDAWKSVGNLYIDRPQTGAVVGRHPFGGMKLSGLNSSKAGHGDYCAQFSRPVLKTQLKKERTEKSTEFLQPDILGEINFIRYSPVGKGVFFIEPQTSFDEALNFLKMALETGNEVTLAFQKPAQNLASHLQAEIESLQLRRGELNLELYDGAREKRSLALGPSMYFVAFSSEEKLDATFLRQLAQVPPEQKFVRRIIFLHPAFTQDPFIFQQLTLSQSVSINTARYGFITSTEK